MDEHDKLLTERAARNEFILDNIPMGAIIKLHRFRIFYRSGAQRSDTIIDAGETAVFLKYEKPNKYPAFVAVHVLYKQQEWVFAIHFENGNVEEIFEVL